MVLHSWFSLQPSHSALIRSSAGVLNKCQRVETALHQVSCGRHCLGNLSCSNWREGYWEHHRWGITRVMELRIKYKSVFPKASPPETHACYLTSEHLFPCQPCCCAKISNKINSWQGVGMGGRHRTYRFSWMLTSSMLWACDKHITAAGRQRRA